MAVWLDHDKKILFSVYSGIMTTAEVLEHAREINALNVPDGFNEIVDFTDVKEMHVSGTQMVTVATCPVKLPQNTLRIIVAPKGWRYGMARLFREYSKNPDVLIVHTMQEAMDLIREREYVR